MVWESNLFTDGSLKRSSHELHSQSSAFALKDVLLEKQWGQLGLGIN
jgi:hypothetical protein